MIRNFRRLLVWGIIGGLAAFPAAAWDYTTTNPCDTPVEIAPAPADGAPGQGIIGQSFSTTVDLNLPLASQVNTDAYNADLSRSEIQAGTAQVNEQGANVTVLGHALTAQTPPENDVPDTKCR